MKSKTLAIFALALLFISALPIAFESQTDTTLTYSIYGEGIDVIFGENEAVGVSVFRLGGTLDLGVDFTDSSFAHLEFVIISVGKGTDWVRYIHRPLFGVPPGIFVHMRYKLTLGFGEDQAVDNALSAKALLEGSLGVTLHPLWEERQGGGVNVLFYAPLNETGFLEFFNTKLEDYGAKTGFLSMVSAEAIENSPYARIIIMVGRDVNDADRDHDRDELVFGVSVGFIVPNATEELGDGWYSLSLNSILGHSEPITWYNESNWSVVQFRFPFPLLINETETTPANSSFPEITGRFEYLLQARDPNGKWNVTWPTELEDIKIVFKPYNYTEFQDFPVLEARLTWDPEVLGSFSNTLDIGIFVENVGSETAYNVRVVIPLSYSEWENIYNLIGKKLDLKMDYTYVFTRREQKVILYKDLGNIPPGGNASEPLFSFLDLTKDVSKSLQFLKINIGPIVKYRDIHGIRGAVLASGIIYPLSFSGSMVVANVSVITPNGTSYVTVDDVVTVNVTLSNYGDMEAKDIRYEVWHAIVDERGNFLEVKQIGEGYIESLNPYDQPDNNVTIPHVYRVRTRPGLHVVGARVVYNATTILGNGTSYSEEVEVYSNFVTMFVLPPYRLRGHPFRYPLPHAELNVSKTVTFDNTTGRFKVRIEITNVGDIETRIVYVVDYWNASQLFVVPESGKIDNESAPFGVFTNDKINVLYVAAVYPQKNITLAPNETLVIEYELEPTEVGTVSIISNPTLVIYDFGPYEMIKEEGPTSEESETATESLMKTAGLEIMQDTGAIQPVQTYTNALVLTVSIAQPKGAGRGILVLIGLLVIIAIAAGIIIKRRK